MWIRDSLSQFLTHIDAVVGAELDPLFVETSGVVALDVRLRISRGKRLLGLRRFAIRPYPTVSYTHLDVSKRQG